MENITKITEKLDNTDFNSLYEDNKNFTQWVRKQLDEFEHRKEIKKEFEQEQRKQSIFWFIILLIIWLVFVAFHLVFKTNASYENDLNQKIEQELLTYNNITTEQPVVLNSDSNYTWLEVKIKLKRFVTDSTQRTDKVVITSEKPFNVIKNWNFKTTTTRYEIEKREQDMMNTTNWMNEYYEFIPTEKDTPLVIKSRDRIPSWITDEESKIRNNDNQFLWSIIYKNINWEETYINKLDIEDYMKWIAETASRTALEKKKAMSIMARSYVYFYTTSPFRKFNTDLYDLEDDPASSQKYLWYWYQQRNEEWVNVVNETNWKVLTYKDNNWKDQSFIAPYSTCTKRNENWELKRKTLEQASWNDETIWNLHKFGINIIQATEDPYWECDSQQSAGHQVWLSWNGSEVLASQHWYTYDQIINYYFKNVTIKKINEMK